MVELSIHGGQHLLQLRRDQDVVGAHRPAQPVMAYGCICQRRSTIRVR